MSTPIRMPKGMAYGWWHFEQPFLADLRFEVELHSGIDRTPGRYFQLYQGQIAGIGMYFGFQTDVARPGKGGQGPGLIFSRWKTRDSSDARVSPGGWLENAAHEDGFVGVRAPLDLRVGRYVCVLRAVDSDTSGVWFEFAATRVDDAQRTSVGSLRFPRVPDREHLIHSGGGSWTEVYSGARFEEDIPLTYMSVSVTADGATQHPSRCDTSYNNEFSHSDAVCTSDGWLHLKGGQGVQRVHAAQRMALGM